MGGTMDAPSILPKCGCFVNRSLKCSVVAGTFKPPVKPEALSTSPSSTVKIPRMMFTDKTHQGKPNEPFIHLCETVGTSIVQVAVTCHTEDGIKKLKEVRNAGGFGICIATKPFLFQGRRRQRKAEEALQALQAAGDFLLVIDNEMLLRRDGLTVLEAGRVLERMNLLATQALSRLLSGHFTYHYNSSNGQLPARNMLSGKGIVRYGSSSSIGKAVEDAFLNARLSAEEKDGVVTCALVKTGRISRNEIQTAVSSLQSVLGMDMTIACTTLENTTPRSTVYEVLVITTSLTHDPTSLLTNSVPGITSQAGFIQAEDSSVSNINGSLDNLDTEQDKRLTRTMNAASTSESGWDSGPHSNAAIAWAKSRENAAKSEPALPVGVRQSHEVRHSYMEVQENKVNGLQPLPHDPAAVPSNSALKMGIDAVLDACRTASEMMRDKDYKKQPTLSQRAASMLENERTSRSLSPVIDMEYKGGVYNGRCEGGLPDGKGRLTHADGSFYDGQWSQGKRNGTGTFYYANGDVYQGLWHDDFMHGKGWLYFHTGDRLQAEFVRGKAHGGGRYYSADGSVLFGQFQDNWRHGECTFRDASYSRWRELWNSGVLVSRRQLS